jgi:Rad3-related DNA helicase
VTSTRDNCLGAECAFHADCFVLKARKAALGPTSSSSTITCSSPT